jgi:hypothetical protein
MIIVNPSKIKSESRRDDMIIINPSKIKSESRRNDSLERLVV